MVVPNRSWWGKNPGETIAWIIIIIWMPTIIACSSCEQVEKVNPITYNAANRVMKDTLFHDDGTIMKGSVDAVLLLVVESGSREGFSISYTHGKQIASEALIIFRDNDVSLSQAIITAVKLAVPK